MTEVSIVQNTLAPYRIPVFDKLDKEYELSVYLCEREDRRKWSYQEDIKFQVNRVPSISFGSVLFTWRLILIFLRNDCDYIIAPDNAESFANIILLLIASQISGSKLILWSGELNVDWSYQDYRQRKGGRTLPFLYFKTERFFRSIIYRFVYAFVSYSTKTERFLMNRGVKKENIQTGGQIITRGFLPDTKKYKRASTSTEEISNEGGLTITSLSYLRGEKGLDYLIEAFKNVEKDTERDIRLVIAGSGPVEYSLKEQAKKSNSIYFPGHVSGDKKHRVYTETDVFVLPTLHDPWGLVINEAMSYKIPVIVTEAAGCSDLVGDSYGGLIVPTESVSSIECAMATLLSSGKTRKKIGENGYNEFQKRDIDSAVEPFRILIER